MSPANEDGSVPATYSCKTTSEVLVGDGDDVNKEMCYARSEGGSAIFVVIGVIGVLALAAAGGFFYKKK